MLVIFGCKYLRGTPYLQQVSPYLTTGRKNKRLGRGEHSTPLLLHSFPFTPPPTPLPTPLLSSFPAQITLSSLRSKSAIRLVDNSFRLLKLLGATSTLTQNFPCGRDSPPFSPRISGLTARAFYI